MVSIVIGRIDNNPSGGGSCCIVYRNERYQEFQGEDDAIIEIEDQEVGKTQTPYDPELDSPSSWTTKSSLKDKTCCDRLCFCLAREKAARLTRIVCNLTLVLFTISGVTYGILGTVGVITFFHGESGSSKEAIGIMIIFGSAVWGAIALILVNLSWIYRGNSQKVVIQLSCWECDCPMAQLAGTSIVLLAGSSLLITYHNNHTVLLVMIFGIIIPVITMVNIPSLFDRPDDDSEQIDQEGKPKEIEVLPGNLEWHTPPLKVPVGGNKTFFKLR
ncbi:expressed unknown protein [Seminavis robusta]|uniref:Uncharacterized protein n=1 Tax=Seminavis robusta TaxID=568900 RepID=A0A9N8HJI3_9STRA|nr:expressed unknown protein [Seminavis robusta]|eukprot:Sro694_g188410.1 n/a (273) ;mRNA; f:557-1375